MGAAATGMEQPAKKGLPIWAKLVIFAVVIGGLIFAMKRIGLAAKVETAIVWIQGLGAIGIAVYVGLYVIATLVGLAAPLTMAAGIIYGVPGAVAIVSPSSVLAATIAFLLGRTVLRKSVEQKVSANPKFAAIERAVSKNGFKIVALVRLSPAFPFTLLNYGLGLTAVRLRDYVIASWIGMLPGTILYAYLGYSLGDVAAAFGGGTPTPVTDPTFFQAYGETILTVVGVIATAAVTIYITKIARAALKEELGT